MADNGISGTENANGVPQLKPCPFCGGEAETSNRRFERTLLSWVYCTSCGSAGGYRYTEQQAIEVWNTRAYDDAGLDALPMTEENMREHGWVRERTCRFLPAGGDENKPRYEQMGNCSECVGMMYGSDSYCPDCGAKVVEFRR